MPSDALTDEQLRQAWVDARRHTWPETFEAAMPDAARSRLVRLAALRLARGERIGPPPVVTRPRVVRPDLHAPAALPPSLPARQDRKRAAAGDDE